MAVADNLDNLGRRNAMPAHLGEVVLIEDEDGDTTWRHRLIVNESADGADGDSRWCLCAMRKGEMNVLGRWRIVETRSTVSIEFGSMEWKGRCAELAWKRCLPDGRDRTRVPGSDYLRRVLGPWHSAWR